MDFRRKFQRGDWLVIAAVLAMAACVAALFWPGENMENAALQLSVRITRVRIACIPVGFLPSSAALIALYLLGPGSAFVILVLRCVLDAVFAGSITSLLFSLCGDMLAMGAMALGRRLEAILQHPGGDFRAHRQAPADCLPEKPEYEALREAILAGESLSMDDVIKPEGNDIWIWAGFKVQDLHPAMDAGEAHFYMIGNTEKNPV